MNNTLVNLMKDYDNYFYDTPRPYYNRAEYGGETKNFDYDIEHNQNKPKLNNTVTLKNGNLNGGEIFDKNKKIEISITRKYNWESRDY